MNGADLDRNPRAQLEADLQRLRSRLVAVRALRDATAGVSVSLALVSVATIVFAPAPRAAILMTLLVAIATIVFASLIAWMRAPSLRQTAVMVDSRLRANDCLVTAVECLTQSDAVADLVVREASRRLAPRQPAEIVPFEPPRRFAALVATSAVLVFVAAVIVNRGSEDATTRARIASPTASPSVTGSSRRQGASSITAQKPANEAASPSRADASAPHLNAPTEANSGVARNAPADASQTATETNQPSDRGRAGNAIDRARENGGASIDRGGATSRGGRGATATARTAEGAGGISGGSLLPDSRVASRLAATLQPRSDARPSADVAWTHAQAAIAGSRVPADLRQLVKDYFTAIRAAKP